MGRRVLQIILLLTLFSGAAAQALACASQMRENHACCQMMTSKARFAAQTEHANASLPPCCQTSAPEPPQQLPVEKRDSQPSKHKIADDLQPFVTIHFYNFRQSSIRLHAPAGYSPPQFILHHALLI